MRERRAVFLAMSGVRIRNERLLGLGMTLPGFVERGKVIASLPSLGLLTIAGLLPPHWTAEYREVGDVTEDLISELAGLDADLYCISSLAARIDEAYRLCSGLRAMGLTVAIGGLHASVRPLEAGEHADAVVIGEGENSFRTLVEDLENGTLQPVYDGFESPHAFGQGGLPRYDLLNPDQYNRLTLQTARGCPLDCSFCAASRLISPYRKKSIDRVREELDAITDIWPEPFIELADDNTFVSKKWSRELVQALAEKPIKWFTECDISVADDERLLELLASSGCAQVLIGLESADPNSLREADSKDWKARRLDSYIERIAKIQSYGISVNGCFVLGFDSDRETVFESTLDFIDQSGLFEVQVTVLTPFAGTGLYRKLQLQGRLLAERFWDRCTLFDVNFVPAQMSVDALENGFYELVKEVYSEQRTLRRKAHFRSIRREVKNHARAAATPG